MIPRTDCPPEETMAALAAGRLSEEAWRRAARHLADCSSCRREAALLSLSEVEELPSPRLAPPLPPPKRRLWIEILRAAAALAVFGALAWALYMMQSLPPKTTPVTAAPTRIPDPKQEPPTPTLPKAPTPPRAPEAVAPPPSAPAPAPAPAPEPEPTPTPASPDRRLAERSTRGNSEGIEVSPGRGQVCVGTAALAPRTYVAPSDTLRAAEAGSFVLPDGAVVHLPAGGEVTVSWSQTLLCYSLDLRKGDALLDLGAAPRMFHVAAGPLGLRLQEVSGALRVSARDGALRATPLGGGAVFRTPAGEGRTLALRETLVMAAEADSIEAAADEPVDLAPRAPEAPPVRVPAPAPPAAAAAPDARELCRALGAATYRYRVAGRLLREGTWHPSGLFTSSVDEFAAVARSDGGRALHLRRGTRPWDDLGAYGQGSREERIVQMLNVAPPPHAALEQALAAAPSAPQVDTRQVLERACATLTFTLDPDRIRDDVTRQLDLAVREGRVARPDFVYEKTLEGSLEVAVTKHDPRLVRAVDRRRIAYSYKTASAVGERRWYHLETVFEFHDHGKAALKLPLEMQRELMPQKR